MVSIGLLLYDGNNIKYFIVIQKKKLIQITRNINSKKKKCVCRKSVLLSFWFAENYVLTVNQLDQTRSMVTNFYTCLAEQNILPFLSFHTNLSPEIWKSVWHEVFKNLLLKLMTATPNSLVNASDSLGINFLTRLCLSLSNLREHEFNYNFQDTIQGTINPFCSCSLYSESITHSFLHSSNLKDFHKCLMNSDWFMYYSYTRTIFHKIASIGRQSIW